MTVKGKDLQVPKGNKNDLNKRQYQLLHCESTKKVTTTSEDSAIEVNRNPWSTDDLNLICVLGRGAYGTVHLGLSLNPSSMNEFIAVKVMRKDKMAASKSRKARTISECQVMAMNSSYGQFKCPFLVDMFGSFQTPTHLFIIMEFMQGPWSLFVTNGPWSF